MIVESCGVKRTVSRARGERGANEREQAGHPRRRDGEQNEAEANRVGKAGSGGIGIAQLGRGTRLQRLLRDVSSHRAHSALNLT